MKGVLEAVGRVARILWSSWMSRVIIALLVILVLLWGCTYWLVREVITEFTLEPAETAEEWRQRASSVFHVLAPQWTPDGNHVIFTRLREQHPVWYEGGIYIVASDGSRLRKMAENRYWPSLSPDGSRIVYSTTREQRVLPFYLETSTLDGSDEHRITFETQRSSDVSPVWSPSGERIAFSRSNLGIYTIAADGSGLRRLFRPRLEARGDEATDSLRAGPVWSPDGQTLAFLVEEHRRSVGPRNVLYTIGADGSGLTQAFATIVGTVVYENYENKGAFRIDLVDALAWSPDSLRLAFIRHTRPDDTDLAPGDSGLRTTLHTINDDGSELRTVAELTHHFGGSSNLSWSPDGASILFVGARVYVAEADGSGHRPVADGRYASWSPDGSRIAVVNARDSASDYGRPTPIPPSPRPPPPPPPLFTIAPDGSDLRALVTIDEEGTLSAAGGR